MACPNCGGRINTYRHMNAKVWCMDCGLVLREEGSGSPLEPWYFEKGTGNPLEPWNFEKNDNNLKEEELINDCE